MSSGTDLRSAVRAAYSAAADEPAGDHPFPTGRAFAVALGYPDDVLAQVPEAAEAFTGVSNVSMFAGLRPGNSVLDLGCGAGLDALVAAGRVGPMGQVYGVDFSVAMLGRARRAAEAAKVENVVFAAADAERLPFRDGAFEVALVNGIFNLNPARTAIFRELARAVRPGGSVFGAELVLAGAASAGSSNASDWFA